MRAATRRVDRSASRISSSDFGRRIWRLRVAYDGRGFVGWQRQNDGVAIQFLVEGAVRSVFGEGVAVHGASRTDAGVHALGQVAHFLQPEGSREFSIRELHGALNAHLPPEVRIMALGRAREAFHARFSARWKRYSYRIINAPVMPPHELGRAWQVALPLDIGAMRAGGKRLVGRHDFAPYSANSKTVRKDTVRRVRRVSVSRKGALVEVTVDGDGFLYRMVRSIVGAMVHVGLGRRDPEWMAERLRSGRREPGVVTAPPQGLYLVKVVY